MTNPTSVSPSLHQITLLCFSHLRWNFVYQRPQHLMVRFSRTMNVLFWEESVVEPTLEPWLEVQTVADNVKVLVPHLPASLPVSMHQTMLRGLLDAFLRGEQGSIIRWYYTPMMLPFSDHIPSQCVVYDCMDELANFRFAPDNLVALERALFRAADLVFTGGSSLYEAKKADHRSVHAFASSVDVAHFSKAREARSGRARLGGPRLGFYGVIDERMDLQLLADIADTRPEWTLILVGPVVKIDPADLPRRPNIHYTGAKSYSELPLCVADWDVALMPFAMNEATRFISPTKTPEYLAAGLPVVSTPIHDVVREYGALAGVLVAEGGEAFVAACEDALRLQATDENWLSQADAVLAVQSWDQVSAAMLKLMTPMIKSRVSLRSGPSKVHYDYLIVGAGFAGAVMAERLAAGAGKRVLVIDKRPHVAGNAFDRTDDAGILIHQYGPHIFHTNSKEIFDYLSRFTNWRPYEHRVLASIKEQLLPIPINRTTLNKFYGTSLEDEPSADAFLRARAQPVPVVRNSEDVVVSAIGRELYEAFFRGYTRKQWGIDPSELDKSVTSRVPTRTCTDDRYFTDTYQAMPLAGYTAMFEKMLDHPNIDVSLGVDFADVRQQIDHEWVVYTGPIDEYFDFQFGKLPYRSLEFRHVTQDREWAQPVAVVNYPEEDVPYTRVTEYKHLTGQTAPRTSLSYEYPCAQGDPYYPIPRAENQELYKRYEALAARTSRVLFVGRLSTYRYYNMDQVIGQALAVYRRHMSAAAEISDPIQTVAAE